MSQPFDDNNNSFSQIISAEEMALGEIDFNLRFLSEASRYQQPNGRYLLSSSKGKPFEVELGTGFPPRLRGAAFAQCLNEMGVQPGHTITISFYDSLAIKIYLGIEHSNKEPKRMSIGESAGIEMSDFSLNTIIYGPPGTGKTYKTAQLAVLICDSNAPVDRNKLMARYEELRREGRISFVTFHQSYGYEDFVEGLRPEMNEGQVTYRVRPGLFRDACDAARRNTLVKPGISGRPLKDRTILKMSLGQAGTAEGRQAFQACIENEIVLLGWGGNVDFSDCKSQEEVLKRAKDTGVFEKPESDARYVGVFKDEVQLGDIIIASHGNSAFQAIGEVTGEYEFLEAPLAGHFHQKRAVRWLAVYEGKRLVEEIFDRKFTMSSLYKLDPAGVKFDVLGNLLKDQQSATNQPFVLIVDEINRANISKVFGELITLLEPDKREGQLNALTVKLPYSGDEFCVPSNLHIVGTMNTADRSIALLDTALRRRFDFEELQPDYSVLPEEPIEGINLRLLLQAINQRVEYLYDRDHTIGHAYLIGVHSLDDLEKVFRRKVIPLLQEYFYENWSKVRAVLNDNDGAFIGVQNAIPRGLESVVDAYDAKSRYRMRETPFPLSAYLKIYE